MSLRAERAEGHSGSDEAVNDVRGSLHLIDGERRRGGTNFQEVAEHRGMSFDCLGAEERPSLGGIDCRGRCRAGGAGHQLQGTHGLRLPAMGLGAIVLLETEPAIIGQALVIRGSGRGRRGALRGGRERAGFAPGCIDEGGQSIFLRAHPTLTEGGFDLSESHSANRGGRAFKAPVDHLLVETESVKEMSAAVAADNGDAHLRHDLGQAQGEGVDHVGFPFFGVEVARGFKSQPGADRARAEANEDSGVMEVAAIPCLDGQAGKRAHPGTHQRAMHGAGGQGHGNGNKLGLGRWIAAVAVRGLSVRMGVRQARFRLRRGAVTQQEDGGSAAHQIDGARAKIIQSLNKRRGWRKDTIEHRQRQFRSEGVFAIAQRMHLAKREKWRLERETGNPRIGIEQVRPGAEPAFS